MTEEQIQTYVAERRGKWGFIGLNEVGQPVEVLTLLPQQNGSYQYAEDYVLEIKDNRRK